MSGGRVAGSVSMASATVTPRSVSSSRTRWYVPAEASLRNQPMSTYHMPPMPSPPKKRSAPAAMSR